MKIAIIYECFDDDSRNIGDVGELIYRIMPDCFSVDDFEFEFIKTIEARNFLNIVADGCCDLSKC